MASRASPTSILVDLVANNVPGIGLDWHSIFHYSTTVHDVLCRYVQSRNRKKSGCFGYGLVMHMALERIDQFHTYGGNFDVISVHVVWLVLKIQNVG